MKEFEGAPFKIDAFYEENLSQKSIAAQENKHILSNVFISHSTNDHEIAGKIVDFLMSMGIQSNNIFCTSVHGYSIPYGQNWLDYIKSKIDDNSLVIMLISSNYYSSAMCMCEMGAAWVKSGKMIPILIEGSMFSELSEVIRGVQSFSLMDEESLIQFQEELISDFRLEYQNGNVLKRIRSIVLR